MSTRLFPTYCDIHEWLYHVSWRSVPPLLKYNSGVKSEGSSQFNRVDKLLLILIWRGKANFFFLFSQQLCVSPTHRPRPYTALAFAICLHQVLEVTEEAFLSQRCSPACCLPSLWLTGYMNISMCCSEQSGSGPPPLLCAGRGCTHSWCPQACEGEELGRWLAVCELLFRGPPGMMLPCKSCLIQEHLVRNLEAFLMFCSKIVIPALWFIFWIAQLWFTSSELWSFWGLVPCWFSWKKEWWHHLLVKIFNP